MSKVYVLLTEDRGYNVDVLKVFSSYSALVSWLGSEFRDIPLNNIEDNNSNSRFVYETLYYKFYYEVHDLIGETSHKTDKMIVK